MTIFARILILALCMLTPAIVRADEWTLATPDAEQRTHEGAAHDAQASFRERGDRRPLVIVYVAPGCRPCQQFERWLAANRETAALRFELRRDVPAWVSGTPAFHYRRPNGWRVQVGWRGVDAILADMGASR